MNRAECRLLYRLSEKEVIQSCNVERQGNEIDRPEKPMPGFVPEKDHPEQTSGSAAKDADAQKHVFPDPPCSAPRPCFICTVQKQGQNAHCTHCDQIDSHVIDLRCLPQSAAIIAHPDRKSTAFFWIPACTGLQLTAESVIIGSPIRVKPGSGKPQNPEAAYG